MYRFALMACLIGSAYSQCQQTLAAKGYDSSALKIAQEFIAVDRQIQTFCAGFAKDMQELFGKQYYQLAVSLPDYTEANIAVKIKHRVVFVNAHDCSKAYSDVHILPNVVDPKRAVWKYWQGKLVILFPYKTQQGQKTCGAYIDENVFIVPKMTTGMNGNCVAELLCGGSASPGYGAGGYGTGGYGTGGYGTGGYGTGGYGTGGNGAGGYGYGDGIIRDNVWHPMYPTGGSGQGGFGRGGSGQRYNSGGGGMSRNGVFGG